MTASSHPAILAIAAAAMDTAESNNPGRTYYQDQMKDDCTPAIRRALPDRDYCVTESAAQTWVEAPADFHERRAQLERLEGEIKQHGRGAWSLVGWTWTHPQTGETHTSFTACIHDGFGNVSRPQTSHLGRAPTWSEMLASMLGMEVYTARHEITQQRQSDENAATIARNGWRAGSTIKAIRIGCTNYATATVEQVTQHVIVLNCTKRGSRNRWRWTGPAQGIGHQVAEVARLDSLL